MSLAMMDPGLGLPGLETFRAEVCNQTHTNTADSQAVTGLVEAPSYGPANEATDRKCLRIGKSLRCGQASCGYTLLAALASIAALVTILYACFRVYNRAKMWRTQRRRLSDTESDTSETYIFGLCDYSSDEGTSVAPESSQETYAPASKRPRMEGVQQVGHTTGRPQQPQTAIHVSVIKFQPRSQDHSEPQRISPPHTLATPSLSALVQTEMHHQPVGGLWRPAFAQEAALGRGGGVGQQGTVQRGATIGVQSVGGLWRPALAQESALHRGGGVGQQGTVQRGATIGVQSVGGLWRPALAQESALHRGGGVGQQGTVQRGATIGVQSVGGLWRPALAQESALHRGGGVGQQGTVQRGATIGVQSVGGLWRPALAQESALHRGGGVGQQGTVQRGATIGVQSVGGLWRPALAQEAALGRGGGVGQQGTVQRGANIGVQSVGGLWRPALAQEAALGRGGGVGQQGTVQRGANIGVQSVGGLWRPALEQEAALGRGEGVGQQGTVQREANIEAESVSSAWRPALAQDAALGRGEDVGQQGTDQRGANIGVQSVGGLWRPALEQEAALGRGEDVGQQGTDQRGANIEVQSVGGLWRPALEQEAALGRGEGVGQQGTDQRGANIGVQSVGGLWRPALEQEAALGRGEGVGQQGTDQREANIEAESVSSAWRLALEQEAALGRGEGVRQAARLPVAEPMGPGNTQRHIFLFDAQSGVPVSFLPSAGTSDSDSDERSSTAGTQNAPILASLLTPSAIQEDYLSHPFARLPVVRSPRGHFFVDFETALFTDNVTQNPLPLLRLVHGLLSQREIAGDQLEFLATLGSKLAAHAVKFHKQTLKYATASRACERLGARFLVLDAIVSTVIVLEQKVSLQLWRNFVSSINHEYPQPPSSLASRGRRLFLANFALLLSNAVQTLKMGFRPSAEELVLLKRMLFCAPYSPPRYKVEGYDAWRFSELVHQGSTGTPGTRSAEMLSAVSSGASCDNASRPCPGTSARLIARARAKTPPRTLGEKSGSSAGSPAGSSKPAGASAKLPAGTDISFLYEVPVLTLSGASREPFSGVFPKTSDGMSLESRSGNAFRTVRRRHEGVGKPRLSGPAARIESHSPGPVSSSEHLPGPSTSGSYLPPLASAETSAGISSLPLSPYLLPLLYLLLECLLERLLDHLLEGLPKRLLDFLRCLLLVDMLVDMLVDIFQCSNLLILSLDRLPRASLNQLLDLLLGLPYFMLKRLWAHMVRPLLFLSVSPLVGRLLALKLWEVCIRERLWRLMVALMMALLEALKLLVSLLKEVLRVILIPLLEYLVGDSLEPLNRQLPTNKGQILCFHLAPILKMEHPPTAVLISSGHQ
ncbi:hypothetical protein, conserved [Eimeria tenella]|uniref:Uncharacterized protein n=1 Tax=Eimeria tenella TaxID=5802 RepID=U6KNA5_EIMTE|nr:hypothetical protein, conserved [Eimeria tenella]CDJ37772.1 hypothetical protein, conserved [Eimeria tenella]|eukprot:XP_013228610.1 hypothetical protein, conserved [Eimeria tenella]